MSDEDDELNQKIVDVEGDVSGSNSGSSAKIISILILALFSASIAYILFFVGGKDDANVNTVDKIVVKGKGSSVATSSSLDEELIDDIISESFEEDYFGNDTNELDIPDLPDLSLVEEDLSVLSEVQTDIDDKIKEVEEIVEEKQNSAPASPDVMSQSEVDRLISEKLKALQNKSKSPSSSSYSARNLANGIAKRPSRPPTSLSVSNDIGIVDNFTGVAQERRGSPIFKMKGGGGVTSGERPLERDSIVVIEKDASLIPPYANVGIAASRIQNMDRTLIEGKIINAVLETAINTDLKGNVRAIISRDVYAEAGTSVLIPKGSRLIGSYGTEISTGQARVSINWRRIIRPDGLSIGINAGVSDGFGRAGLEGEVDNKYVEILSAEFLSSMIAVATAVVVENVTDSTGIVESGTNTDGETTQTTGKASDYALIQATEDFMDRADELVDQMQNLQPTIRVAQGTKLLVFLNTDIALPEYEYVK